MKKTAMWSATLGAAALLGGLVLGPAPSARAQSETAWLGVYTQELDDDLREGIGYNGAGVLVTRVLDDSPADRAGIRKGDVITRVGSRSIDSPDALSDVVRDQAIGARATVRVVRDRTSRDLDVTFAARPERTGERRRIVVESDDEDDDGDTDRERPGSRRFEFDFDDLEDLKGLEGLDHLEDLGALRVGPGGDHFMFRGMSRGRLGVRIESLNDQLGEYFQAPDGKGVLVMEVMKDTPAERAGLRAGDVITKVGSDRVDDADDLIQALRGKEGQVAITVLRRGASRTVEAELEKAEAPTARRWTSRSGPGAAPAPRVRVYRGDRSDLQDELEDLRRELRELKEELKERK